MSNSCIFAYIPAYAHSICLIITLITLANIKRIKLVKKDFIKGEERSTQLDSEEVRPSANRRGLWKLKLCFY